MIPQAELAYDGPGNYSTACTDTKVASMLTAITNTGATPYCYTYNNSGLSDVNLRYGATALLNTSTIQAYSVSGTGVTTWDAKGVNSSGVFVDTDVTMTWAQANTACSTAGGRLPTLEELYTLSLASFTASVSYTPPSFVANKYWSSTTVPSTPANAYLVNLSNGGIDSNGIKTNSYLVRCVR